MYSAARVSVRIVFRMRVRRPESHWQAFLEEPRHLGPSSSVIRVTASSVMGADCVFRLTSIGGEDAQNGFAPSGDFVAVGVCLRDEGVDEFGRDAGVFALEFDDVGGVVEFGVGEELFE